MECMIVRALLPRYLAGLTSSETNRDLRNHLEHCESCRSLYEGMKQTLPGEDYADTKAAHIISGAEGNIPADPSQKMKKHVHKRSMLITLTVCVIAVVFLLIAANLEIPLSYDANKMQLKETDSAIVPLSALDSDSKNNGYIVYPLDDLPFKLKKEVIEGSIKPLDLVCFSYSGINEAGFTCVSRTVMRKGKAVRMVYFCYDKTLWNAIRYDDFSGISESGSAYGDMYDDSISDDGTYSPAYTEVYYLRDTRLHKLKSLSDDDYMKKADQASLIWSGNI